MAKSSFKVGLIGFGNGGRYFHAPLIHVIPGLELSAIVTTRPEAKTLYPGTDILDSVDTLLADPTIDLVVVATPHRLHTTHARMAIDAGKHVVVEKPLAATSAEAATLARHARESGRMLITYHNRRWDGDFLTVQQVIDSGTLGDIYYFESHWDLYRPTLRGVWREDPDELGGIFYDLGPHMIDQALLLFGKPESVYAQIESHRPGCEVDDLFRVHLRFPPGVSAVLVTDMLASMPGPRFHIQGKRGTFEKYGLDPQESALRAGQLPQGNDWGKEESDYWGQLHARDVNGLTLDARIETRPGDYRQFYQAVYKALLTEGPAPVDPEMVILQLRVIEAALRSARSNTVEKLT